MALRKFSLTLFGKAGRRRERANKEEIPRRKPSEMQVRVKNFTTVWENFSILMSFSVSFSDSVK